MRGFLTVYTKFMSGGDDISIPDDYRGISFHSWLDIFLQYALLLAQNGDVESSYGIVSTVSDANVFYHSPDSMFLIHVCWFSKYWCCYDG